MTDPVLEKPVLEASGLVAGYGAVRVVHGIDLVVAAGEVVALLGPIAREGGIGVLFVEQHVQFALDLADRAYLMNRGRIALSGTGAELRTRQDLVQASYLGE